MSFNVVKLLQKKRDNGELADEEIKFIVQGFVDGKVADYQMSTFLAFVYCRGMNTRETQVCLCFVCFLLLFFFCCCPFRRGKGGEEWEC